MSARNKEISILTDTEAETSMELDASLKVVNRDDMTNHNATKSVFNITLDNFFEEDDEHNSLQYRKYEEHLKQEVKDWHAIYRNAMTELKKNKEKHPRVDLSLLSAKNRAYLEKAPNLQNFRRESIEFRCVANNYLEKDYVEACEIKENLVETVRYHINTLKTIKDAEQLAKM